MVMQPITQPVPAGVDNSSHPETIWSESTPWGLSPQQILSAYSIRNIQVGLIKADGAGQTIAIVDAYDDPSFVDSSAANSPSSDLARFDQQFGLSDPPSFVKVNQLGSTTNLPGTDPTGAGTPGNWEEEEAMDVEWTHALAPDASIVLVECTANTGPDLYQGVKTAASLPGVSVVSMSWGCSEFSGEATYDSVFTTPSGHQGVTFVASSGDSGSPGLYPAYSPNVVGVGATSLSLTEDNSYDGETVWSGSGNGTSLCEPEPAYQSLVQNTGMRTIPDVSLDGDPNSGVSVYDSYNNTAGYGPWKKIGGTSLGAPCWTALIAIVNQVRVAEGSATLHGPTQTLPALYALAAGGFHIITTPSNLGSSDQSGYEQVSGLGSPVAKILVPALASYDVAPRLAVTTGPPNNIPAGEPFGLTVQAENPDGSIDTGYIGDVSIRLEADPGAETLSGTLTVTAHDGFAVFSGLRLTHAANGYTLCATTDGPATAATAPFAISAASPKETVIATTQLSSSSIATTVWFEDAYGNVASTFNGSVTVQWRSIRGKVRIARYSTLTAAASQGVATISRITLGLGSRSYVLQVSGDGMTTQTIITLRASPALAKPHERGARAV